MKFQNRHVLLFVISLFYLESAFSQKCTDQKCGPEYGSQKIPGSSCADILEKRRGQPKDGIYWIKLGQNAFPVFCTMTNGGWTLVFKLIAGVSGRPATLWDVPFQINEYSLAALNTKNNFNHHYKNRIVQNWNLFKPSEVRTVMYSQGKEKVVMRFNADNTNNMNWFSQQRITEAPWQDIKTASKNYFSLAGPCPSNCRDFFINHLYRGCPSDVGWHYVGDGTACQWESRFGNAVKLIYSKESFKAKYSQYAKFGSAEVFSVYLR